jgi:mannose-1-phosphate guanylyltransferase/phosphomannomutase
MKAVILAGGKGTRLFPLTTVTPKPLIMIRGRPVIRYIIDHIMEGGISEVIVCLSDQYEDHFRNALGNGSEFGVSIVYSSSPAELATSGRILRCAPLLERDDFLIYYADILTRLSLRDLLALHSLVREDVMCTLAVSDYKTLDIGAVKAGPNNRIEEFIEKPLMRQISSHKVNIGIGVCKSGILEFCRDSLDLFGDVVPDLLRLRKGVAFKLFQEPFVDIGTLAGLEKANDLVKTLEIAS